MKYNLSSDNSLSSTYERFSAGTDGSINVSGTDEEGYEFEEDMKIEYDITINGISGVYGHKINNYISINGGAGYYFGDGEVLVSYKGVYDGTTVEDEEESASLDLSGFGFKVGGDVDYPIEDDYSLTASLNYRILDLDAESDEETTDDDSLTADGFELKGGIAYSF
ncbi:MAG: hypothetical protein ACOC4G_08190 [Bacillota bacterium]